MISTKVERKIASTEATIANMTNDSSHLGMNGSPPDDTIAVLGRTLAPLVDRTIQNDLEVGTLSGLRDALLPKLISGELRVKDAETFLDRVL